MNELGYTEPVTQINDIQAFICWYVTRNSKSTLADNFSELDQKLLCSLQRSGYMTLNEILYERIRFDLLCDVFLADAINAKEVDVITACRLHEKFLDDMGIWASDLNRRYRDLFVMQWFDAQLKQLGAESKTVNALVEQRADLAAMSRAAYEAMCRAVDVLTDAIRRGAIVPS